MLDAEVLAEGDGDVLLLIAHLGQHGYEHTGGVLLCSLNQAHVGHIVQNGLATLLFVVGQLLIGEMRAGEAYIFLNLLLVNLRTGQRNLRVGQEDGNLIAMTLDVFIREIGEVDICFQRGIHRNGYLTFAQGQGNVEVLAEKIALQPDHIVVGDNLVDVGIIAMPGVHFTQQVTNPTTREEEEEKKKAEGQKLPAADSRRGDEEPNVSSGPIVSQLKPIFYGSEDEALRFLKEIRGMKPVLITQKVKRLIAEKSISELSAHRDLWAILHTAGIYDRSESNWNQQVK